MDSPEKKIGARGFKYRMASDEMMTELSGYKFNAVTPFFMKNEQMPILLDKNITDLEHNYIWMGGGRLSLKLGISL